MDNGRLTVTLPGLVAHRALPSIVHRQSSSSISLYALHQKGHAIKQNDQNQKDKVERTGNDSGNSQRLSRIFVRLILDLHQREDPQTNCYGCADRAEVTTPPNGDTENATNERCHGETLLGSDGVPRRWWRLPDWLTSLGLTERLPGTGFHR